MLHWILLVTGIHIPQGQYSSWYNFWSGLGSDISEFAILGGVFLAYKKINCHVEGCPKIGHFQVNKTPYKVCRKHHPDMPKKITHLHIIKKFKEK